MSLTRKLTLCELAQRRACRSDERYAAHRSRSNCSWHRPACERHRRSFNGRIDEFRISQAQRSDGWIETTWNNMSDPGAFAVAGAEEQEGSEPLPPAGARVVVCLMA